MIDMDDTSTLIVDMDLIYFIFFYLNKYPDAI
jgi:hypothetical protein